MTDNPAIAFDLDGQTVYAETHETLWQVAKRCGNTLPHLCHSDTPGYRSDGNCRACMVEIDGERTLAASCIRRPEAGMKVKTTSPRANAARRMVMELLFADQPPRAEAHDTTSRLLYWSDAQDVTSSRFPRRPAPPTPDRSHPAMAVHLDACIHCTLCVRACREVQVNDVIGMAGRGNHSHIVFDFDDPMGESSCVACGECVQACPTGALMPATIVDDKGHGGRLADDKVASVCPYCGVGCQLTYHLRDGDIAWVEGRDGPSNQNRLCVKGRFGFDYIKHRQRLKTPLIRRAGVAKTTTPPTERDDIYDAFREASWDEALAYAANGLQQIRDQQGPRALAGFGSAKGSNEEAYLFQKLVRTGFGSNNVDHCTRLCHASSVAALMEGIGSGAVTAPFTAACDADVIIVIGANPTENHPVAATYFKQAARQGADLIVIDPRRNSLAPHARHMLQFRPGSDVALLNAMLNTIISENLCNSDYINAHTKGFEQLAEHCRAFTPEIMAPICGIRADLIRQIARLYATAERSIIFWGMGISQHTHGTDNARCLISLALITGQIGRPGTGLHPLRGQNNVQGASDVGLIPMAFPDYRPTGNHDARALLEKLWQTTLDPEPGLTVVEIINAASVGTIRGMYILGENPAMSDPDLNHARHALTKLDHLVVQDIFPTETAWFADVILPAAAWPEKDGTVTNTNRQVQRGHKAVEPPGLARPDWWIIGEIARRLGLGWNETGPEDVFAEMKQTMPSLDHISWQRLEKEDSVVYPCRGIDQPGDAIVFGDGFPTPDGRAQLVPAAVRPPDERPDGDYPMVLTTGRQLEHWHTGAMTRRATVLDTLEPAAVASLSPDDLSRLSIRPGETIRITTRRGAIELVARSDSSIQPGSLFIPFAYVEAAANMLTNAALDPVGKIPEFKYCAARVERIINEAAPSSV